MFDVSGATSVPSQKNGRIAYTSDESGPFFGSIYTIDPRGGAKSKVTAGYQPSYSPDGKGIAYWAYDKSSPIRDTEIYTIKVGGGDKTQLTHNNTDEFDATYSPDGKRIAYTAYKGNAIRGDIYTIKVGGGGRFRVTHTDNADEATPSWGSRAWRLLLRK
jgi:hypothetical protein